MPRRYPEDDHYESPYECPSCGGHVVWLDVINSGLTIARCVTDDEEVDRDVTEDIYARLT
jgi:hypothetical protein